MAQAIHALIPAQPQTIVRTPCINSTDLAIDESILKFKSRRRFGLETNLAK
jgi:hypothetical protein